MWCRKNVGNYNIWFMEYKCDEILEFFLENKLLMFIFFVIKLYFVKDCYCVNCCY